MEDSLGLGDLFLDERGTALRATWHRDQRLMVLSVWREGECIGAVRLDVADAARLSSLLMDASIDGLRASLT